jgi:arylsulfatase A-like enzyme
MWNLGMGRSVLASVLGPWLALLAWAAVACCQANAAPARPNVIIILSDDQGYGDFSCHGNPVLKTPNLDRLHSYSVSLTDFHVAPMCTPTRGQLLTGLDALHNGAASVSAGRSFVRRGIPTMADIFSANGYKTALFGKWHLGDSYPHLPHYRGFQEAVYHLGWGITSMADTWENDYFNGRFYRNGVLQKYPGYCTDVWFNLSMNWIKERHARKEPFFLYLPTNAPHGPLWVADKYKQPYQGKVVAQPAAFFGMIANLDENIGRLEQLLSDTGLRDNTIVIFMNDNGGTAGVRVFNAGLRAGKTTYYDGGHRAACFIRWPAGDFGEPRDENELTQVQDILPTLIDLCGLKKPADVHFDGHSLASLLRVPETNIPDRMLVVQYGEQPGGQKLEKWRSAVMWHKWRLVHGDELYDLRTDPGQQQNVAVQHPAVLKKLRDHYERWWAGVESQLDNFEPVSIGADQQNPVTLSAADWNKIYCDNMQQLRAGREANGPWHVLVEKDGTYEFRLRRWPRAADAAIAAGVPAFKAVDGGLPEGKALPIAKARLRIADLDETKPVTAGDKEVVFSLRLKAGQKLPMQTWFYDGAGRELCGAYFVEVERR